MKRTILCVLAILLAGCAGEAQKPPVMVIGGDAQRGREVIRNFGCGTCHEIPGVRGANGRTGPPLTHWRERTYIAGNLLNNPDNLMVWVMFPDSVEPGTAMPTLGLSRAEAADIAAYLYTIKDKGLTGPPRIFSVESLNRLMPRSTRGAP